MTTFDASLATQGAAAALISRSFAYDTDVLPLAYDGVALTVAVATESPELLERIREMTRKDVRTVAMPVRDIRAALRTLYPVAALRDADSLASQTLDDIFAAAIRTYASDVHIEPTEEREGRVRLDIDGVLHHERGLDGTLFDRVVSLLKVRGNMNTGESRIPQDGRLSVNYDGRSFDVRASTIPVAGREKVVLRFLQRFDLIPDLDLPTVELMADVGAAIVGDPDQALAQCRRWEAAGCDQITFGVSGHDLESAKETIRLLGEYVIPKIDTEPQHSTTRYRQAAAKS